MPSSPKRHGIFMEDLDWHSQRTSTIAPSTPRLSFCTTSDESMCSQDGQMPTTPKLEEAEMEETDPVLLPGFHFSTMDASVDPAEFHRIAAQLLSGESAKRESSAYTPSEEKTNPFEQRHLHCDLGKDPAGRFCCSCGKTYSTGLRLREHISLCAGASNFPCQTCDKVFTTREKLDRHVATRHNSNLEACPECGEMFRADELPKHLASGLGGCDGMVQVSWIPEIDPAYTNPTRKSASQQYWIYEGDHNWKATRDEGDRCDSAYESNDAAQDNEVVEKTRTFVTQLLRRPMSSESQQVACDLCGDLFESHGEALAQHIGEHSLDFSEKSHKCDECRIFFANEKDLERHLQSADLNQHCGFTFRHNTSCSGHHPPTYFKSSLTNDHNLMQKHVWAWEQCQLRTHRATVASMLAQRMSTMASTHMSSADCKRMTVSLLPHFSVASRDSMRSSVESGWIKDQDATDLASLDEHFTRIIDEEYPAAAFDALRISQEAADRPDSTVISSTLDGKRLGKRKSLIDLAKRKTILDQMKKGHKRYALSASGFALLMKQAARDESRPSSLPPVPLTA